MEVDPPRDERVIKIFKEVRQSPLDAMAVGVGVKSELKDLGELKAYFEEKGVKVQGSIMIILPFEKEKNRNNPLIDEFRRDLEKKYKGISVLPRETKEGTVLGLTIWIDLERK